VAVMEHKPLLKGLEAVMNTLIELESEFLLDESAIRDPYLRLMAAAIGRRLIRGSPWLTIRREVAEACLVCGNRNGRACPRNSRQIVRHK
jgi:hypothetical protein